MSTPSRRARGKDPPLTLTGAEGACGSTCTRPSPRARSGTARRRGSWRCARAGGSRETGRSQPPRPARGRGRAVRAPPSYDVVLADELTGPEAGRAERSDVKRGPAVDDELRDEF